MRTVGPGRLALTWSSIPSSGWMWRTSRFGSIWPHRRPIEEEQRRAPELDHDLRAAPGEPLAGPQVERHAGPAPVLHEQLQRGVRLGRRGRRDLGLAAVRPGRAGRSISPSPYWPRTVRSRISSGRHRPDRLEHLHLLVADRVGRERDRRLHRDEREELEHVVLDHVAQHARRLVVVAALLDAHRLRDRQLDVVDVASGSRSARSRPLAKRKTRMFWTVSLPEVVIDPVDLAPRGGPGPARR